MMDGTLTRRRSFYVVLIAVVAVLLVDATGERMRYNSRVTDGRHGAKRQRQHSSPIARRMQAGNEDDYDNDGGMSMPLILDYFDYDPNIVGVGGENDNEAGGIPTDTVSPPDITTPCFRGSRNFLRKKGTTGGTNGRDEEEVVNCDSVAGIGGIADNDGEGEEQQEIEPAAFQEEEDDIIIPASCQLGSRNYRDATTGKVRSCSTFGSINSNSLEDGGGVGGNSNSNMEAGEESNDAIDIIDIGGSDTTKDDDSTTTTTTSNSDAKQDDEIVWVVVDLDNGSVGTTTTTSDGTATATINKKPPPSSTAANGSTANTTVIVPLATDTSTTDAGEGLSSGAIAGIAIAAITSLIVLAVASTKKKMIVYRNKNNNEDGADDDDDDDLAIMDVTHIEKERIATSTVSQTPTTGAAATTATRVVRMGSPDATAITASFSDVTSTGGDDADDNSTTAHHASHHHTGGGGMMVRVLSGSISSIGEETPNGNGGGGNNNTMVTSDDSPYFVTPYHTSEMNDYYAKNSLLTTTTTATNNVVDDEESSMLSTPSFFSLSEEDPAPSSGGEADTSIAYSTAWSVAETIRRFNSTAAATPTNTGSRTGGSSLAAMGAAGNAIITSPGGRSSTSRRVEDDGEVIVVQLPIDCFCE